MRAKAVLLALGLLGCDGWDESPKPPPPAPAPPGSVARGAAARQAALAPPGPAVDAALLARGADRHAIFCAPCHGPRGQGDGVVVARGFPAPPATAGVPPEFSLRAIATNQGGAHPFEDRLSPYDRWAIARFLEAVPR